MNGCQRVRVSGDQKHWASSRLCTPGKTSGEEAASDDRGSDGSDSVIGGRTEEIEGARMEEGSTA